MSREHLHEGNQDQENHGHDGEHGYSSDHHGASDHHEQHKVKEYFVDIEGTIHPWNRDTITFEEIVQLGGWDASQGVVEIDKDNNERTLHPGDVIDLKPGHGFSKKIKWKRG